MSRRSPRSESGSAKRSAHIRQADILANAIVNDSPAVMGLDQLDPDIQAHIATGRLKGFHPVSVHWPAGEFALMFCEPGTNMPSPEKILEAYYQCLRTNKTFPKGDVR